MSAPKRKAQALTFPVVNGFKIRASPMDTGGDEFDQSKGYCSYESAVKYIGESIAKYIAAFGMPECVTAGEGGCYRGISGVSFEDPDGLDWHVESVSVRNDEMCFWLIPNES